MGGKKIILVSLGSRLYPPFCIKHSSSSVTHGMQVHTFMVLDKNKTYNRN